MSINLIQGQDNHYVFSIRKLVIVCFQSGNLSIYLHTKQERCPSLSDFFTFVEGAGRNMHLLQGVCRTMGKGGKKTLRQTLSL
jgi:hypothetical protein